MGCKEEVRQPGVCKCLSVIQLCVLACSVTTHQQPITNAAFTVGMGGIDISVI